MPSYKLENSIPFGAAILTSGKDAPQFKFGLFLVLAQFTELTRVRIPTGKKWPVLNCKILTQNIQTGQHLLQGTTFHSMGWARGHLQGERQKSPSRIHKCFIEILFLSMGV